MSTTIYDEQIIKKFKSWTMNTNIHIYGPDDTKRLFEVIADTTNDEPIKLPIICLRRTSGYEITNMNQRALTYDGLTLESNYKRALQLNAIPITISYQLDVYTRYYDEADSYMRDIVFNIINHPSLKILIPYNNANIEHVATIRLSSSVEDNSSISERLVAGQFTRLTIQFNIDDAYLFDARIRNNYQIGEISLNI